uniref:Small nuclear ribonucleoprotein G n=1 Tax=Sparus aurata TaxID=8175 RepID=A0A671TVE9_SPAAU
MSKAHPPELKKFMDKKLSLKLNGGRHVQGILRGFDPFMNLVVDDSLEMGPGGQQNSIGMVVSTLACVIQYFSHCNKSPCNHSLFTMWCTTFTCSFLIWFKF